MHTLAYTRMHIHAVFVSHTRTTVHCINATACAYMYRYITHAQTHSRHL